MEIIYFHARCLLLDIYFEIVLVRPLAHFFSVHTNFRSWVFTPVITHTWTLQFYRQSNKREWCIFISYLNVYNIYIVFIHLREIYDNSTRPRFDCRILLYKRWCGLIRLSRYLVDTRVRYTHTCIIRNWMQYWFYYVCRAVFTWTRDEKWRIIINLMVLKIGWGKCQYPSWILFVQFLLVGMFHMHVLMYTVMNDFISPFVMAVVFYHQLCAQLWIVYISCVLMMFLF